MSIRDFIVSSVYLFISVILLWFLYDETWLFSSKVYLIVFLAMGIVYLLLRRAYGYAKNTDRMIVLSLSFVVVAILSSVVHSGWKLTNYVESSTMLKISIILLVGIAVYLNAVYLRAEHSYKRKRGNQRLKEEPKEMSNPFKRESVYDKDDIVINF